MGVARLKLDNVPNTFAGTHINDTDTTTDDRQDASWVVMIPNVIP